MAEGLSLAEVAPKVPFLCAWGPTKGTLTKPSPVFLPETDASEYDLAAVEAAEEARGHRETDTAAYEERVRALEDLAQELEPGELP